MTNRFKGLDLIDRVPEDLWTEVHDIVDEAVIKTISKKKKCKKCRKVRGGLKNSCGKKRSKGEKERYTHLNAEFQRIERREESLPQ